MLHPSRVAIEHDGDLYLLGLCARAPMASRRRLALRTFSAAISAMSRRFSTEEAARQCVAALHHAGLLVIPVEPRPALLPHVSEVITRSVLKLGI